MAQAENEPIIEPHLAPLQHPPGFRARRGLNWGCLGLMYTSFYMCRYNFSIANKSISEEFGFSKSQMGIIITTTLLAYALGQIINGLLTDRMGGKRAMITGAVGTVVMNVIFGAVSASATWAEHSATWKMIHLFTGQLGLFTVVWGLNGYMQAFGAPGMIKVNAAWFHRRERGRFAGIFGFMINLGRFGIFQLGPALLAGFTVWGMVNIPALHWKWLFYAPAAICAVVAVAVALFVKDTPEEAGFPGAIDHPGEPGTGVRADFATVFWAIVTSKTVWIVALAYACTGAVRQGIDQWFPRFMEEHHHVDLKSAQFQYLAFLIPFVASAGSLISGYVSDMFFKSKRAPVAAVLYLIEGCVILLASQSHSPNAAVFFLVLISFTANATHSILGTAAAMDIGGRQMAGFASGLIDSFQYFGGSVAGLALGYLLDRWGWNVYFYFMAPFGFIGCLLMAFNRNENRASAGGH